jgi:hypothetical protein
MPTLLCTVIGDLVGSRDVPDRAAAQRSLGHALDEVNRLLSPAQPFEPTVGDEFQGACDTLPDAVLAALLVRLALLPVVDSRCGLGAGPVTVHDASRRPLLQDGPGWWAAREAIDVLGGQRAGRTWYAVPEEPLVQIPDPGPVNAFLACRDQIVGRLNERGTQMLRLALTGRTQKQIAEELDVWPSAVSQQFARGIGTVVDAQATFAGSTPGRSGR